MSLQDLFKCLEDIRKLGSPGWTTEEAAADVLGKVRQQLALNTREISSLETLHEENDSVGAARQRVQSVYLQLLSNIPCDVRDSSERLECGCIAVSILHEVLHQIQETEHCQTPPLHSTPNEKQKVTSLPQAPPGLLSVHQVKVTEDCMRMVVYTLVNGCLRADAGLYLKTSLARAKFVLGKDLLTIPVPYSGPFLAAIMRLIIPVMKHENVGAGIRSHLFPELLTALLELSFAPDAVKTQPLNTAFFRGQLQEIMNNTDSTTILRHLLFLLGFVSAGSWLGRACGALMVRSFLTQPGGVAAVIGAGLAVCDGQDWRRCEAVASIIAYAKTRDLQQYYASIGPQICELVQQGDSVKGDVMRVVVLTVAQLATRSHQLTATHIISPLLYILIQTTLQDDNVCLGANVTACLTQMYRVFVEIPPPNPALTSLLRPVLCPLVKIAALPTTHLRSTARYIIVRYLSQLSREDAVDALFIMTSLSTSPESPPVVPDVIFTVDDAGGVKVEKQRNTHNNKFLEEDDNLSKCIIAILELLKNSSVVIMFYKLLTEHIDFSFFSGKVGTHNLLLADDVTAEKFDKMHRIVLSCNLLENLSESEAVTNDLFTNLSAAVPIVSNLITAGCHKCIEEPQLQEIQTSLIMNTVLLVSCYVSDRTLKKKMSSEDWTGLKELLPVLENVRVNTNDEAILLFTEQLKNLVLTHGAVNTCPTVVSQAKRSKENLASRYKEKNQFNREDSDVKLDAEVKKDITSKFHKEVKVETHSCNTRSIRTNPQSDTDPGVYDIEASEACVVEEAASKKEDSMEKEGSYEEAMEDLFSPLLPVRGHALLVLSKLLERRDKKTLAHRAQLLSIFQHNLKEEDSYLYLMAVEGLAVLCDVFPDKVVETLTAEYSTGNRSCEDRAKLAEVLVRATRRLGPHLPQYRDTLINALLNGMRAEEGMVRAASLSALGDVCKLLRFSIGPVIHEIFGVLYNAVKSDEAAEVRRAAVLVVTLLLQGLGQDALKVLRDVMRDLYRALRLVHATDPDPVVRLHAQLAMEEVDTATRRFLMPRLTLTKHIYVTDMPRLDL